MKKIDSNLLILNPVPGGTRKPGPASGRRQASGQRRLTRQPAHRRRHPRVDHHQGEIRPLRDSVVRLVGICIGIFLRVVVSARVVERWSTDPCVLTSNPTERQTYFFFSYHWSNFET